jgi:hypothetical protein
MLFPLSYGGVTQTSSQWQPHGAMLLTIVDAMRSHYRCGAIHDHAAQ